MVGFNENQRAWREREQSGEDQWEKRRQELAARGDIFDAQGNVTPAGQDLLIKESGWTQEQVRHMEYLQRNHTAPVEVIRPAEPSRAESRANPSRSPEASRLAADARARAEKELADRLKHETEARNALVGRQQAGIRAYEAAIRKKSTEADAKRAQLLAERAFDQQYQRSKERPAA